MYEAYQSAVRRNHSRDFEDFTQFHRDVYMRLKLRDLSYGGTKTASQPAVATDQVLATVPNIDSILAAINKKNSLIQSFNQNYDSQLKEIKDILSQ